MPNLFKDPGDEEKLCTVLKTFVEEWGPENVVIMVPKIWEEYSDPDFGQVKCLFNTINHVIIAVVEGMIEHVRYAIELNSVGDLKNEIK